MCIFFNQAQRQPRISTLTELCLVHRRNLPHWEPKPLRISTIIHLTELCLVHQKNLTQWEPKPLCTQKNAHMILSPSKSTSQDQPRPNPTTVEKSVKAASNLRPPHAALRCRRPNPTRAQTIVIMRSRLGSFPDAGCRVPCCCDHGRRAWAAGGLPEHRNCWRQGHGSAVMSRGATALPGGGMDVASGGSWHGRWRSAATALSVPMPSVHPSPQPQ